MNIIVVSVNEKVGIKLTMRRILQKERSGRSRRSITAEMDVLFVEGTIISLKNADTRGNPNAALVGNLDMKRPRVGAKEAQAHHSREVRRNVLIRHVIHKMTNKWMMMKLPLLRKNMMYL